MHLAEAVDRIHPISSRNIYHFEDLERAGTGERDGRERENAADLVVPDQGYTQCCRPEEYTVAIVLMYRY